MNPNELAQLTSMGALPAPALDAVTRLPVAGTVAKAAIGHARTVFPDGTVEIVAFCFDGTDVRHRGPAL